jgi:hypothetical protein
LSSRYFGMVVSWCRGPRLSWSFTLVSGADQSFST